MPAERLYYADSALTQFSATVTDIREHSRPNGTPLWQIALDRTAFYPTSGGQPHDTGTLAATAPSGATLDAPILNVEEDEQGEVWHLTAKPLGAGTAIAGRVDSARRLDHMQQHSGQHLLSALFYRELNAATVSFHLGDEVSTIDLNIPSLDPAQLAHIERLANTIVAEARPVTHRTVSRAEAEQLLTAGTLRKLPDREGDIRLVVIAGSTAAGAIAGNNAAGAIAGDMVAGAIAGNNAAGAISQNSAAAAGAVHSTPDLDLNACGGTHVTSTSQIGAILLRDTERIRQSIRVSFICGSRAIAAARADDALLSQLSRELSTGRAEILAALARLKADTRAGAKERQILREELANYHAARLLVEDQPQQDLRIVRRIFPDRDVDYIKLLAGRVTTAAAHTVALLASTQHSPATLVIASSEDLPHNAGTLLRSALAPLGGKGGGSPTLAQGQLGVEQLAATLDALEAELRP